MEGNPGKLSTLTAEERKARKAARRDKQRTANLGRALKMHKARLESPRIPDGPAACPPLVNVGCSGGFYWHWRGLFYEQELPTKNWFSKYADNFQTVELNAPFYSWPTVNAVKIWLRQAAAKEFVYTVKVCELITHLKHFSGTKTLVLDFGFIADLLGSAMGCFLYQLPPSFDYSPARLKSIVGQMDPSRRNVVEFRHKSWWDEKVYDAFRQTGIMFCSCSAPGLPEDLVKTTDEVYIRFHGRTKWYRHDYSDDELNIWQKKIVASGCQRVWAYFNNDFDANAVKNALAFREMLMAD